jgi:hypothetical protein
MRVLKEMAKNQLLLWDLYAGIARNVIKNSTNTMDQYASIVTNEECQQLFVTYMRVLQEMPKKTSC